MSGLKLEVDGGRWYIIDRGHRVACYIDKKKAQAHFNKLKEKWG